MPMDIDSKIVLLVNRDWSNPFFDTIMPHISRLGSGEFLFLVAVILIAARSRKDKGRLGILLSAGLGAAYYVVSLVKYLVGRPRPFMMLSDVNLLSGIDKGFSFPSNHTAMAFMAATILSAFFGRFWAVFYALAFAVGFSRIYIGAHFFSDVAAGAVIGSFIGFILLSVSDPQTPPRG